MLLVITLEVCYFYPHNIDLSERSPAVLNSEHLIHLQQNLFSVVSTFVTDKTVNTFFSSQILYCFRYGVCFSRSYRLIDIHLEIVAKSLVGF